MRMYLRKQKVGLAGRLPSTGLLDAHFVIQHVQLVVFFGDISRAAVLLHPTCTLHICTFLAANPMFSSWTYGGVWRFCHKFEKKFKKFSVISVDVACFDIP